VTSKKHAAAGNELVGHTVLPTKALNPFPVSLIITAMPVEAVCVSSTDLQQAENLHLKDQKDTGKDD
jgi:hypothetical protein